MASKTKVTSSTGRTQPGRASEGAHNGLGLEAVEWGTSLGPRPTETQTTGAASATSGTGSATEERTVVAEARDLQRVNRELQVRIRELELQLTGGAQQADREAADYGEASEESNTVIAIIKDLHSKVDAAYELKEAIEADVAVLKDKLAEEQAVHAELEACVKLLDAKVALGDQLREDLVRVEGEREELACCLEQTPSQLDSVRQERDRLAETYREQTEGGLIDLEAKVAHLEDVAAGIGRLRTERADTTKALTEAREESERLKEDMRGLKNTLDATKLAKNALELELTTARELVCEHEEQVGKLTESIAATRAELAGLRAELTRQKAKNGNLVQSNERAEREIRSLKVRIESLMDELDSSKQVLRDIRTTAIHAATCIRGHNAEA